MRYATPPTIASTPIDPALRATALRAAECLRIAASLEDAAELFGRARGDKSKPLAEQVLALRDDYKQQAVRIVREYLNPETREPFTGSHVRTENLETSR